MPYNICTIVLELSIAYTGAAVPCLIANEIDKEPKVINNIYKPAKQVSYRLYGNELLYNSCQYTILEIIPYIIKPSKLAYARSNF